MLNIIHSEDEGAPGKIYADACWRANPRIAASFWREVLGFTVGKMALDWREGISQAHLLAQGVNLVVVSPGTHGAAMAVISASGVPVASFVVVCVTEDPVAALSLVPVPALLVWQVPGVLNDAARQVTLTVLEEAVKAGTLSAYGIADADLAAPDTPRPLHIWLAAAAAAASSVWGRRKRPALRALVMALDLLNFSPLTTLNTLHHEEPVSPLELAARLGLAVIAMPQAWPVRGGGQPCVEALRALSAVAGAEHTLNQLLGGWPHIENQPLFSVLASLSRQQPPWATPAQWYGWQRHQLPLMSHHWLAQVENLHLQGFVNVEVEPAVEKYFEALSYLEPHGAELANYAAQPRLNALLEDISPYLPKGCGVEAASTIAAVVLSSLPGVGVLALSAINNLQTVQILGDLPDLGFLFTKPVDQLIHTP